MLHLILPPFWFHFDYAGRTDLDTCAASFTKIGIDGKMGLFFLNTPYRAEYITYTALTALLWVGDRSMTPPFSCGKFFQVFRVCPGSFIRAHKFHDYTSS
jgi:hypothetical protein